MKSLTKSLSLVVFVFILAMSVVSPFVSFAQEIQEGTGKIRSGLIPCGNAPAGSSAEEIKKQECGFIDLLALGQNIIKYLVLLSIPIAALSFAWAGFLYLTSSGDTGKIKKAKEIFWKVMWGFIFILTAWLLVYVATSLLDPGFNFLLK